MMLCLGFYNIRNYILFRHQVIEDHLYLPSPESRLSLIHANLMHSSAHFVLFCYFKFLLADIVYKRYRIYQKPVQTQAGPASTAIIPNCLSDKPGSRFF